jgi:RHS repeat-associated protein
MSGFRYRHSGSHIVIYDANGNATSRFGQTVTWSSYNYPTQINGPNKTLSFLYDAHRNRYRQTYTSSTGTETTHYAGGLLEKVVNSTGTDWRHYVNVGGQVVAVISRHSNGTNLTRYMLEDQQGSPSNILNADGTSFVQEAFTAFGQRRDAATWQDSCLCDDLSKIKSVSRRGYTGHEAIGGVSMGLNHMNGRVQDAITGRFLSADPYGVSPGLTQSFNRYAYVMNNPMSYIDPSGYDPHWGEDGYGVCEWDVHTNRYACPEVALSGNSNNKGFQSFVSFTFGTSGYGAAADARSVGPAGPAEAPPPNQDKKSPEEKNPPKDFQQCMKDAQAIINAVAAFTGGAASSFVASKGSVASAIMGGSIGALASGLADTVQGSSGNALAITAIGAGAALVALNSGGGGVPLQSLAAAGGAGWAAAINSGQESTTAGRILGYTSGALAGGTVAGFASDLFAGGKQGLVGTASGAFGAVIASATFAAGQRYAAAMCGKP